MYVIVWPASGMGEVGHDVGLRWCSPLHVAIFLSRLRTGCGIELDDLMAFKIFSPWSKQSDFGT
jgi:hypothetical protein